MLIGSLSILVVWACLDWLVRMGFSRSVRALPNVPRTRLLFFERGARVTLILLVSVAFSELFGFAPQDLWTAFSTILGLIAVGLVAFWSVLSSLICGLILVVARPFNVGDTIEIFDPSATDKPGTRGTVIEMSTLFTILQDAGGQRIYLPHNQVLQRGIRISPRVPKD